MFRLKVIESKLFIFGFIKLTLNESSIYQHIKSSCMKGKLLVFDQTFQGHFSGFVQKWSYCNFALSLQFIKMLIYQPQERPEKVNDVKNILLSGKVYWIFM